MKVNDVESRRSNRSKLGRRAASESGPSAEDIAKIALDLFAKGHYSTVTIRDIGNAAGVNSAMIYYHFKDKNELFRAAIGNAIGEAFLLFAKHREMGAYDSTEDALHAWFEVHMILHERLRNVIKIGIDCKCLEKDLPDIMEPIREFYIEERKILRSIFSDHEETANLSDSEKTILSTLVSTSLDGILARSILLEDFDIFEYAREFERLIVTAFQRPEGSGAPGSKRS